VVGKRKTEIGLVVLAKYTAMTNDIKKKFLAELLSNYVFVENSNSLLERNDQERVFTWSILHIRHLKG